MEYNTINVKRLTSSAKMPKQATSGSSGFDLHADATLDLMPGQSGLVGTGLAMNIPYGYEGQIRPRSGLAAKYGITVLNAPGTIDSDYAGEIKVLLINHGTGMFHVESGDRIAQIVFAEVAGTVLREVSTMEDTERGTGGFGSTGK